MAANVKRKRGAVSYKEPSSEDSLSEDSEQEDQIRRKRPAPPSRPSTRRREPRSARTSPAPTSRLSTHPRSHRHRHREQRKVSYKDVSTDEDDEDPDGDFEVSEDEAPREKLVKRSGAPSPRPTKQMNRSPRKLILGAPLKPNEALQTTSTTRTIPTDGHQPAWASLPYHVLLQVFVYASHPLRDENMKPDASIQWLAQVARACSAFTKPALTALYRCPPIFAMKQTRKDLVHHLISPPADAHEDPRVMVKRLELDPTQMLALTDHHNSVADLAALIRSLTTLREIDIFDPVDRPPFRGRIRRIRRWVYPPELFEALRQTDLRIRSWRWNREFCSQGPLWMKEIHGDAAFQSLRELALIKFHPVEMREDQDEREDIEGEPTTEELVASALATLPNLKSLSFETCGIVSDRLPPLLPTSLVSLNITNCGELLSEHLQAFLATHGTHLEELVLNHNQSLDLSFLVDLKQSCPRLETLRMDMTYYSSLEMSSDNEPLYESLLGETEMPTWPSTLRSIDLEYLRKWNSTAATNFFSSLIDAAEELPWLREIVIIAMVDTDWRQRAEFRRKWTDQFREVFAQKCKLPSPHLVSLRAYREWKAREAEVGPETEKNDSLIEDSQDASKEKEEPQPEANHNESDSDSDVPLLNRRNQKQDKKWDSTRLRSRTQAHTGYGESSDEERETVTGPEDELASEEQVRFVQGRCHTVLFRIDNFRPREEIYGEADFLDAEPSGDEEWNGNDDHDEEGGYAW